MKRELITLDNKATFEAENNIKLVIDKMISISPSSMKEMLKNVHYYKVDDSFIIAPAEEFIINMTFMNYANVTVSNVLAGIIITSYALNYLCWDNGELNEQFNDKYYGLLDYVYSAEDLTEADRTAFVQAID